MDKKRPNILQMTRAPFLSSIFAPLIIGTLAAVAITGNFLVINFFLVLVIGIGLHVATNVYNDIYDTFQGTDKVNVHRNEFSGGSGVLVDFPDLLPKMFFIARISLIIALAATIALMFFIDERLIGLLLGLYFLAAFFSKYYTAKPVKLAYRRWGEISVWFAFGPMAIMIAAVSQNIAFHSTILFFLPITGISTLSILMIGQLIDLKADKETGKLGMAARIGTQKASYFYLIIQLLLVVNILVIPFYSKFINYWIYLSLAPYIFIFPGLANSVLKYHNNPKELRSAAKKNVLLHLSYSSLLITGLLINLI